MREKCSSGLPILCRIGSRLHRHIGLRAPRYVISFPKSGRTWLRVMLDDLRVLAEYTHDSGDDRDGLHCNDLRASLPNAKRTVLLMRDPRDTSVSNYYEATRRLRLYTGSISEFLRDPCYGIEKCARFNLMWAETARVHDDMILVSYEAMHEDAANCLHAMLNFFGCPRPDQEVRAAVQRNRFDIMQKREIAGEIDPRYNGRLGAKNPNDSQSLKCRKGRVGGYRDELNSEDITYCDTILANLRYFDRLGITPHDTMLMTGPAAERPEPTAYAVGKHQSRHVSSMAA
jgi:sulfotransferase family protein